MRNSANPHFPSDIVQYATGSRFLPQHGAEIVVEFNFALTNSPKEKETDDLSKIENNFMKSHTCERTLVFPVTVYEGKVEKLASRIDDLFEVQKPGSFNMT